MHMNQISFLQNHEMNNQAQTKWIYIYHMYI